MQCLVFPVADKQSSIKDFPESFGPLVLQVVPPIHRTEFQTKVKSWHFKEDGSKGGDLERPSPITLGAFELAELGVPTSAKRFAWCYQAQGLLEKNGSKFNRQGTRYFLQNGGFMYMDAEGSINQILAVASVPEGEAKLRFGHPQDLDPETVKEFQKDNRFHQVTVPYLRNAGAREYMWLTTGELACAPHGGFAYLMEPTARADHGGTFFSFCCGYPTGLDQSYKETEADPVETKAPEVVEKVFQMSDAVASVARQLPNALPRVCILGGRKFQEKSSELLVKELAKAFAAELKDRALVLTGGLEGIQETFATNVGLPDQVVNMVPEGTSAEFKVGKEVHAGANLGERIQIFGQIGDIYLTIEGGPGVSKEATAASERGAVVLPMAWTGGASSGMFDFPKQAFTKPDVFSSEEWRQVMEKTNMDAAELAQSTAKIVICGIAKLIERDLEK